MDNLDVINQINELQFNQIDYTDILNQLNENLLKNNEFLEKIHILLEDFKIPIFLLIFSIALLVALSVFDN